MNLKFVERCLYFVRRASAGYPSTPEVQAAQGFFQAAFLVLACVKLSQQFPADRFIPKSVPPERARGGEPLPWQPQFPAVSKPNPGAQEPPSLTERLRWKKVEPSKLGNAACQS